MPCNTCSISLLAALLILAPLAAGEDSPTAATPSSVYAKFDYMHLEDSTPMEYFALELGEWRPVQAQRIRRGVTNAWHFYEMMPGARRDSDAPYDYITVSIFPAYENASDPAGTEAIFDVYPGIALEEMYDRADAARSFVRSDLWKVAAVVSPDADTKPLSEYLLLSFLDGDAPEADEVQAWLDAATAGVRDGELKSAALLVLRNPDDEGRPYTLLTIQYADGLPGLLAAGGNDGLNPSRTEYKAQVWRLIDSIHESEIAED